MSRVQAHNNHTHRHATLALLLRDSFRVCMYVCACACAFASGVRVCDTHANTLILHTAYTHRIFQFPGQRTSGYTSANHAHAQRRLLSGTLSWTNLMFVESLGESDSLTTEMGARRQGAPTPPRATRNQPRLRGAPRRFPTFAPSPLSDFRGPLAAARPCESVEDFLKTLQSKFNRCH